MPRQTLAEKAQQEPKWFEFYRILNDAANSILQSVILRKDVPEDAKHLLRAVYYMRDLKDFYTALGDSLTPDLAASWADELQAWASANPAKGPSSSPLKDGAAPSLSSPPPEKTETSHPPVAPMGEVSPECIPYAQEKPSKKPRKTVPRAKAPQNEASLKNQPPTASP